MSTKVKGQAIKEGSIPLSALSEEIKNKIENSGGGADWNALKGEPGYIENKPFSDNIKGTPIKFHLYKSGDYINIYDECFDMFGEELSDGVYAACFNVASSEVPDKFAINLPVRYGDKLVSNSPTVINMENIDSQEVFSYYDSKRDIQVYLFYARDSDDDLHKCIVIPFWYGDISELLEKFTIVSYRYIQTLDEKFIPDTVIKTTPQTLSDTDKNQALTNLGIDLIDFAKKAKIIIDFNKPGRHTFEEYGIDLATANGIFLMAMIHYLNGESEPETLLVDIRNEPEYDSDYTNSQYVTYIGHTYTQHLDDYEKDFGYEIDILQKAINIWGV